MNKYRFVSSDSDGHVRNQCLSCKTYWVGHSEGLGGWKFCPFCGIEFVGEHKCVPHDERHPEWYGRMKRLQPHFWWIIEKQYVYKNDGKSSKWERVCVYPGFDSARHIHEILARERAFANSDIEDLEWWCEVKFRIRISHNDSEGTCSWWIPQNGLWGNN